MPARYTIQHAPADNRFDLNVAGDPLARQMIKWDLDPHNVGLENVVPTQVDSNGDQAAGEMITSGSGSPQTAAQLWERTARQWRAANPDQARRFTSWIGSGF